MRIHRKLGVKLAQPEAQLSRIEPGRHINTTCIFCTGNSQLRNCIQNNLLLFP
jgi:hypothetical protein